MYSTSSNFYFSHKFILAVFCYNKGMQKKATQVFIVSSVIFGVLGVFMALTGIDPDQKGNGLEMVLGKLFMASVFIILTSFALSVASKYLNGKS